MAVSQSGSMPQEKVYAYKLIKFVDEPDSNTNTDLVPAHWVHYDEELQDICTRFMPPPYTTKNCTVLHTMIKSKISPPDSWPKYRIEIRGEAETHAVAVKKVEKLRLADYAFSTDSEETAKQKSSAARKSYLKQKQTDPEEIEKLMNVPPLPDDDNDATDVIREYHSSSSSSGIDTTGSKTKQKRQRRISSDSAGDRGSDASSTNLRVGLRKQQLETALKGKKSLEAKQTAEPQVNEANGSLTKTVSRTGISVQPVERLDKSPSSSGGGLRKQQLETVEKSSPTPSTILKGKKTLQIKQTATNGVDEASASLTKTVSETSKKGKKASSQVDEDDSEISITRYLRSIAIQQTKTTEAITELKRLVESIGDKLNPHQAGYAIENQQHSEMMLAEKLGMTFPLQNVEDLERFDVALKNPTLKELLRKEMLCLMEMKLPLQRNIGNILKKFMARDLLRSYTAVKKTVGKGVLKSTNLYQRIQENIMSEYSKNAKLSPISDKKFGDAVGAVINSAKDWEGRRLLRSTKSSSNSKEAATKETATEVIIAEETNVNGEAITNKDSEQI